MLKRGPETINWTGAGLFAAAVLFIAGCGETPPAAPESSAAPEPAAASQTVAATPAEAEPADDWPREVTDRSLDPGYTEAPEGVAPLLEGIGDVHFPITSDVERAQDYFNQALTFSYGFNHAEAARSFREAARLDPQLAVAHSNMGTIYRRMGDYEQAIDCFVEAVRINPFSFDDLRLFSF